MWVLLLGLVASVAAVPAGARTEPASAGAGQSVVARPRAVGVAAALEAIDNCIQRLNPDVDTGYDRIVARCPTLARRLEESGVAVWLPRDWQRSGNDLSVGGLRALRELLLNDLSMAPYPGGRQPGIQSVPDILASLTRADDERSGWWSRARVWLRDVFAGTQANDEGWLGRMIGQSGVPQTVVELVSFGALALVVVLAVVIVANELWVGGVRGGRRRRVVAGDGVGSAQGWGETAGGGGRLDWEGVCGAPVAQRLGLLLELVVARLNESGTVRLSRGLTGQELLGAVRLGDEMDQVRLGELVRASERARYSGGAVLEAEVAVVMEEGKRLLEAIGQGGVERKQ